MLHYIIQTSKPWPSPAQDRARLVERKPTTRPLLCPPFSATCRRCSRIRVQILSVFAVWALLRP